MSRETKFSDANEESKILIFPVQLTTSRTGNLTRLIHTLLLCVMSVHSIVAPLFVRCDGWQNTRGSTGYTPRYFLFFSSIPWRVTYNFSPRFFRPHNFHIFVFLFCFAVCHKEWPYDFSSRCKFRNMTTRQSMVEFYLLTFPRFPLLKKEHKPTLVRIELTTSALLIAGVQVTYYY